MFKKVLGLSLLSTAVYLLFQDNIISGAILFFIGGLFFSSSFSEVPVEYSDADFSIAERFGDDGGE